MKFGAFQSIIRNDYYYTMAISLNLCVSEQILVNVIILYAHAIKMRGTLILTEVSLALAIKVTAMMKGLIRVDKLATNPQLHSNC